MSVHFRVSSYHPFIGPDFIVQKEGERSQRERERGREGQKEMRETERAREKERDGERKTENTEIDISKE